MGDLPNGDEGVRNLWLVYTVKKHRVKNLTVFDGKLRRRLVEVACTDDAGRD